MKRKITKRTFAVIIALLLTFSFSASVSANDSLYNIDELIPGGMAFGVKFFTDGVVVLGTTGVETASGMVSPAKDAGLSAGDIIIRACGVEFTSANELLELVSGSGGKKINIAFVRNGEEKTVEITPARDIANGVYRLGVLVRDSTAGIGTVTFIDPETLDFGGLGHGIYDTETGILLPLGRGAVVEVEISEVVKSERNSPGELKGRFGKAVIGNLWDNGEEGVFGRLSEIPDTAYEPMPIAEKEEVHEGKAYILTTLSEKGIEKFEIEIERIYPNSGNIKNFVIHITDENLISKTGGIVQGMSGSPIIQDGKLIGAVTHVLVNDPTRGYGIFIENMIDSAYDADIQHPYSQIAA